MCAIGYSSLDYNCTKKKLKLYLIILLLSSRFQLKSQFDKNVVTHFEAQEQVLDYIFSHLGVDNEGSVPHPIVMTEAFVTPNYSRQCKELLINFR